MCIRDSGKPGLVVALDSGDAARLGEGIQGLLREVPVVNIDHHPGNPEYGSAANWVDPAMPATGEMIGHLAEALELPLEGALAEAVYVALVSDTGSFAYGNTRPSTLRMADVYKRQEHDITPFDLVCVNLYDFASALEKKLPLRDMVEEIDIGGPCLLRASAKNFHSILVVSDPRYYDEARARIETGGVDLAFRKRMAALTFAATSRYDAMISSYLSA